MYVTSLSSFYATPPGYMQRDMSGPVICLSNAPSLYRIVPSYILV